MAGLFSSWPGSFHRLIESLSWKVGNGGCTVVTGRKSCLVLTPSDHPWKVAAVPESAIDVHKPGGTDGHGAKWAARFP